LATGVAESLGAEVAPLAGALRTGDPGEEAVDERLHTLDAQALAVDGRQIGERHVGAIDPADAARVLHRDEKPNGVRASLVAPSGTGAATNARSVWVYVQLLPPEALLKDDGIDPPHRSSNSPYYRGANRAMPESTATAFAT
jgi:hypothetical protein